MPLLLTVDQAAEQLQISRARLYQLLSQGAIRSVHIGRLHRIPAEALAEYVDRLSATPPDVPRPMPASLSAG